MSEPVRPTATVEISFEGSRTAKLQNQIVELLSDDNDNDDARDAAVVQAISGPSRKIEETGASVAESAAEAAERQKRADEIRERGNKFFNSQQYHEAIREYSQAIVIQPHNSVLFCNRAMSWLKLNDHRQALVDATTATEIDPMNVKGFLRRSAANEGLGRLIEALQDATMCLQLEPQSQIFRTLVTRLEKKVIATPHTAVARQQQQDLRNQVESPVLISSTRQSSSSSSSASPIPSSSSSSPSSALLTPISLTPSSSSSSPSSPSTSAPSIVLLEPMESQSPFFIEPVSKPEEVQRRPAAAAVQPARSLPKVTIPPSFTSMAQFELVWLEVQSANDEMLLLELWNRLPTDSYPRFFGDMLSAEMITSFLNALQLGLRTSQLDEDAVRAKVRSISQCSRFGLLQFFLQPDAKSLLDRLQSL